MRGGRPVRAGWGDSAMNGSPKIPGGNSQGAKRSEIRVGVLVDQADYAVASVRHGHVSDLSQPQSCPDRLPGHRKEPGMRSLPPGQFREQLAHRLWLRGSRDHQTRRVLKLAIAEPTQQLPQILHVDQVLRMPTSAHERDEPAFDAPGESA